MDIHQAQAFLVVAEELHFGRAAARLNMAQPPLSRLIKQLERALGAELFERSTRHVSITAAGRALLEPAQRLLDASQEARDAVQDAVAGRIGRVRLGFAGASINRKVGELARQVRARRPGVVLELHSSQFSHLGLERVLDGSLDLVIGRWDYLPAEISSRVIAHEQILVALPAQHPLAQRHEVRMEDLAEGQWISLPGDSASALSNRLRSLAMQAGFVPRITQTAPDSWTQVVLVGAQMGCALTMDSVRDNVTSDGVVFLPIQGADQPLEVRMIWRAGEENPALRDVVGIVSGLFAPLEGAAAAPEVTSSGRMPS